MAVRSAKNIEVKILKKNVKKQSVTNNVKFYVHNMIILMLS